jgi:hypothetical protein
LGSAVLGCRSPRIISTPHYRRIETGRWSGLEDDEALAFRSPAGTEAIELAESAGLVLDDTQSLAMHHGLVEDHEGRWESFEVCLNIPRQNGKGGWLEARQLAGVLLFGDMLVIHTAHEFKTAQESFARLDELFAGSYDISRRVRRVSRANGDEGFYFFNGARIRFLARSGGSGRGFSGDLVIMDECMKCRAAPMGALLPVMSARRNPQLVYAGSAGLGEDSEQLAYLRARALAETSDPDLSLTYIEHSIDPHVKECPRDPDGTLTCTDHDDRDDERSWARANPTLGRRIRPVAIAREIATLRPDLFDIERLGVGVYPSVTAESWLIVAEEAWRALGDVDSQAEGRVAFAADINPERSAGSIAVAGRRADGRLHTEVVEHRLGTAWMVPWLLERVDKWMPCALVIDGAGPAGALIPQLETAWDKAAEQAGTERPEHHQVIRPTGREVAQAYGSWRDEVAESGLRHMPHPALDAAVAGAKERPLGEARALTRTASSVDISPLVATTLAAWGHMTRAHIEPEEVIPWAEYG